MRRLTDITKVEGVSQKWYVDDGHGLARGPRKLRLLKDTWSKLKAVGQVWGFDMHARKCALIVHEKDLIEASALFADTGITVCTGFLDLGARVGSGQREATKMKVDEYLAELKVYERLAVREPQVSQHDDTQHDPKMD